jgi:hypothetical protein
MNMTAASTDSSGVSPIPCMTAHISCLLSSTLAKTRLMILHASGEVSRRLRRAPTWACFQHEYIEQDRAGGVVGVRSMMVGHVSV